MTLSTNRDMITRAERALRRGDMRMAELYISRSLAMTREERLSTGHPAATWYYLVETVKAGLQTLAPLFNVIGQSVKEFNKIFEESLANILPSQTDFDPTN